MVHIRFWFTLTTFTYHDQHAGQNHNIRICNKFSERVEQFKYLGTNVQIKIAFVKKLRAD